MELIHLTGTQLEQLPRDKTVFFFPVGPLEDHGPHLPLGLDLEEAERLCFLAVEHLSHEMPDWKGVVMPKAPLGIDTYTTHTAISVRAHVLRDWLVDSCQSLIRLGFVHFVCFSGNLGPRQLSAIEDAGWIILRGKSNLRFFNFFRRGPRPTLISASSALIKGKDLLRSGLWLDGPEHGGERDTSVALAMQPEQVDPSYQSLPALEPLASRWERIRYRFTRQSMTYWGNPSAATAEAGGRYLLGTIDEVFPKMRAVWEGHNPKFLFKSWYSLVPFNRSFFKAWLMIFLLMALAMVWFSMNYLKLDV